MNVHFQYTEKGAEAFKTVFDDRADPIDYRKSLRKRLERVLFGKFCKMFTFTMLQRLHCHIFIHCFFNFNIYFQFLMKNKVENSVIENGVDSDDESESVNNIMVNN